VKSWKHTSQNYNEHTDNPWIPVTHEQHRQPNKQGQHKTQTHYVKDERRWQNGKPETHVQHRQSKKQGRRNT